MHSPISSSQTQLVPLVYCRSSFLSVHREHNGFVADTSGGMTLLNTLFPVCRSSLKHKHKASLSLSVCEDSLLASGCQWPYPCTSSYHTCPWWSSLQTGLFRAAGSTQVRKPRTDVSLWHFPSPEHTSDIKTQHTTLLRSLIREIHNIYTILILCSEVLIVKQWNVIVEEREK